MMEAFGYYNDKIIRSRLDQDKDSADYWSVRSATEKWTLAEPIVMHMGPELWGLHVEDSNSQLFAVRI